MCSRGERAGLMNRVSTLDDHNLEKAELGRILGSRPFLRAPTLSKMLAYICEKHFVGQADRIKEYNIAVEALGRGSDFDSGGDSIVRVEAAACGSISSGTMRQKALEAYCGCGLPVLGTRPGSRRSPRRKRWTSLPSRMPRSNPSQSAPPQATKRKTRQQFRAGIREWRWPLLWR